MEAADHYMFVLRRAYLRAVFAGKPRFTHRLKGLTEAQARAAAAALDMQTRPAGKTFFFSKEVRPVQIRTTDRRLDAYVSAFTVGLCYETCTERIRSDLKKNVRPPNWAVVSAMVLCRDGGGTEETRRVLNEALKRRPELRALKSTAEKLKK